MPEFNPNTPSVARVYDYVLGGKDNYAADREVADRLLTIVPLIADMAVENRQFLSRAATWAANQGISQFIDLGCGLPTTPNTHQSVQSVNGCARVAYIDNDPVVIRHLQALFAHGNPGVSVVDADVSDVSTVLDGVRDGLDLSAPACLLIGYLLHFYPAGAARDLVAKYASALPPGSCVKEVTGFFGPLELVPPGVLTRGTGTRTVSLPRCRRARVSFSQASPASGKSPASGWSKHLLRHN